MIESISGASEAPSPSNSLFGNSLPGGSQPKSASYTSGSAAASIAQALATDQTLATEKTLTSFAGAKEAATRHSNETASAPPRLNILHARSLGAVDDAVVRNLLDSLSPASRIAGSFFLADGDEPAQKSLIAMYYEDV